METQYKIITVNAYELFWKVRTEAAEGTVKDGIKFCYRYDPATTQHVLRSDNALFYQVRKITGKDGSRQDDLLKSILFIDFSTIFKKIKPDEVISKIGQRKEDTSDEFLLTLLLHPKRDISVDFGNGDVRSFVPYDKSASMAKKCQMSFIDKDIQEKLNERLELGIDFDDLEMRLSKYYAYRGLYLSTGKRIAPDKNYPFNEKTVIVIPDMKVMPDSDFLGEPKSFSAELSEGSSLYKFNIYTSKAVMNAFDGEGLISAGYAGYLNDGLNAPKGRKATSFQVRMPFIKGMLHQVDFMKYLRSECGEGRDVTVNDIFGIPRRLKDAEIILTESMFKCSGWLRDYWKKSSEKAPECGGDPMRYFFKNVNDYDHAIYVCTSDLSFSGGGPDRLNYQYLATLKLGRSDFESLIGDHFDGGIRQIEEKYFGKADEGDPVVIKAAKKNSLFYRERSLKDGVRLKIRTMQECCGIGQLLTVGEHRYYSADLVAFLQYLHYLSGHKDTAKGPVDYRELGDRLLYNRFYMAAPNIPVKEDTYAALYRSPHLSRNEECILRPAGGKQKEFFDSYFGHLKGVIMTPISSCTPMILGGADFDADTIKILTDEKIVNAIKKGAYIEDPEHPGDYYRRLPFIDIPKTEVKNTRLSDETFNEDFIKLILHTFSNLIGKISNLAVRFADMEYFSPSENTEGDGFCARSTLITGLEIDAAKNGGHPSANIDELFSYAKDRREDSISARKFLECKELMKNSHRGWCTILKQDTGGAPYYLKNYGIGDNIAIYAPGNGDDLSLMLLPYSFARRRVTMSEKTPETEGQEREIALINGDFSRYTGTVTNTRRLIFGSDEEIEGSLDGERKKKIKTLIDAFHEIRKFDANFRKDCNRFAASKAMEKLDGILMAKYDSLTDRLPGAAPGVTVRGTCDELISLITASVTTIDGAAEAMERFRKSGWLYTEKKQRREKACRILGIPSGLSEEKFTKEMECLVCDFSSKGYLILFLALSTVHDAIMAPCTPEESFRAYKYRTPRDADRELFGKYLGEFLSVLQNTFNVTPNEDLPDDLSEDETEDRGGSYADTDLCLKARSLLSEIEGEENGWGSLSEDKKQDALKHVYALSPNKEDLGAFFWEVLPEKLILESIMEDKPHA